MLDLNKSRNYNRSTDVILSINRSRSKDPSPVQINARIYYVDVPLVFNGFTECGIYVGDHDCFYCGGSGKKQFTKNRFEENDEHIFLCSECINKIRTVIKRNNKLKKLKGGK